MLRLSQIVRRGFTFPSSIRSINISSPARILSCVAAYDGHDASILGFLIIRSLSNAPKAVNRAVRDAGRSVEIIYQGYNRKVNDIVKAAIEEDVDIIALSSYNGGHRTFFPAVAESLRAKNSQIALVGGGGATITPDDIKFIESNGVTKIFDTSLSLNDVAQRVCDIAYSTQSSTKAFDFNSELSTPQLISLIESEPFIMAVKKRENKAQLSEIENRMLSYYDSMVNIDSVKNSSSKVVLLTGVGGAGKSTIADEIVRRFTILYPDKSCAVLCIDPTLSDRSALLGDRIRMNNIYHPSVFMRSMATRIPYNNLPYCLNNVVNVLKKSKYDFILIETPGVGQVGIDFSQYNPDSVIYVKTKEFGSASVQLGKDQLLKTSNIVVLNKIDREGSKSMFQQIREAIDNHCYQTKSTHHPSLFATEAKISNEPGMTTMSDSLFASLGFSKQKIAQTDPLLPFSALKFNALVPHARRNYLARVVESVQNYDKWVDSQLYCFRMKGEEGLDEKALKIWKEWRSTWKSMVCDCGDGIYTSQNGIKVPKVSFPDPQTSPLETLRFLLEDGLPGCFPYVNGVFPMKREDAAETTRQFAGLRLAEHTNERFKMLSQGVEFPRLSTAFDGITLYGDDSGDDKGSIGKIGEGGVAVSSLDDMKILYSDFDFNKISTSLTINGPAPATLAMFINVAFDSTIQSYLKEHPSSHPANPNLPLSPYDLKKLEDNPNSIHPHYGLPISVVNELKANTLKILRGTVQADILKEAQAQNECIFPVDIAIRLMGDIQEYFIQNSVKKFYSMSISGYHIGEAGATPIQEMAFTIANGFTYLENFLGRSMKVDEISRNFSFFFRDSNEIEWLVLGPVLRKIWGIALRDIYGANTRSQAFKYHTQTSGRALQLNEWDTLNPIRQTMHALIGLLGNTNSLHVDSADEPLTTPSEKWVRQATMIPNYLTLEAELLRQQNLLSGSYAFNLLRKAVQEAVLDELMKLDDEGGVPSAMELAYQRKKISDSSLIYEHEIAEGKRPIIGRNICVNNAAKYTKPELMRPNEEDFTKQLKRVESFKSRNKEIAQSHIDEITKCLLSRSNCFNQLVESCRYLTLGQISRAIQNTCGSFSQSI